MIKSFRIQNFKILRDIRLNPAPVNVLIGPNGCGKSSLLQALDFLRAFFMSSIEVYLKEKDWGYKDLPNVHGSSRTIQWQLVVDLEGGSNGRGAGRYEYFVSLSPRRYVGIGRETLDYTPPNGQPIRLMRRVGRRLLMYDSSREKIDRYQIPNLLASAISAFDHPRYREAYTEMRHLAAWIRRFGYFLIWDPKVLRKPARGKHSLLGPSGEHLAPILANLKKRRPNDFQKLLRRLKPVFPNLVDISFSGSGWGWRSIRLHERRGEIEFALNNQQVSDGLLRLLAVTSLLYLDNVPTVIMFEEPENGVHPHLLREILHVLSELTLRKAPNKAQVFFTTHSPYVLDEFYESPEQVWIMDIVDSRAQAQIARLSEKSQLEKAKKSFGSLGEAWFSNVIGGTPSKLVFE